MFLTNSIEVRGTKEKGKGVFASAIIEPGTVIGDYLGIVTKPDEGLEYEDGAVYDMWYSDEADICPEVDSKGVHLINCSCEPNCGMTAIGRHTVIFALRKIFPGEEITYDYFMGDQDEECDAGTDNCHCGSELCRGTMYSNPKAYEAWEEYLEEIMGEQPEKPPVAYGEHLPPLDEYPESIDDHPIYPLFGTHANEPVECTMDLLSNREALRAHMRETGCQLLFPELGIIVEGIMYGGHMVMKHVESGRVDSHKAAHEKEKAVAV